MREHCFHNKYIYDEKTFPAESEAVLSAYLERVRINEKIHWIFSFTLHVHLSYFLRPWKRSNKNDKKSNLTGRKLSVHAVYSQPFQKSWQYKIASTQ